MAEVIATVAIAAVTGLGALNQRLHTRISELDSKVDRVELLVAKEYVSKADLSDLLERVEAHMARIETKLDNLMYK